MTKASGVSSFLDAGMCKYDAENPPREPPEGAGWVIELRGSTYHKEGRQFILDTLVRNLTVNGRLKLPLEPVAGATPAPAATPATPAEGQPAPVRRPDDEEAMMNAVVKDRARWVFLFNYGRETDPKPGAFKIIGQSYIREVLAPAAASTGPGTAVPPSTGAGSGPSGRDAWEPLTGGGGGNSGGGGGSPAFGGRGGDMRPGPRNAGQPVTVIGAPPPADKPGKPRFEFVVMFFWQEPTPSDGLMNLSANPAGPSPTSGGR
jgi:hypothetical protein